MGIVKLPQRRFDEPSSPSGSSTPPEPPPTVAPAAPSPPPAPVHDHVTRAELDEIRQQVTVVSRTQQGIADEIKGMREDVTKQLAATRVVNAPQPPAPPQAVNPDNATRPRPKIRIREPYANG